MRSKLALLAAHLAESGWLAALVVVPIFFNVYTVRIFEEEKIPLFRSIALVVLAALIVSVAEGGAVRKTLGDTWRLPVVKPAALLVVASALSTWFSLRPDVSFWGGYVREQGMYTFLCYLAIFFALLVMLRRRDQVERLLTVVMIASLPLALYAIAQRFGADPIGWVNIDVSRSTSTAGNAIFVAAFMVMVAPLALARCIEHKRKLSGLARGSAARRSAAGLFGLYVLVLALQLVTIVFTESRGPFVGLCAGLIVFGSIHAARAGWRWMPVVVGIAVAAGALFLVVLNSPIGPLASLREAPLIGRFSTILPRRSGSVGVRVLIWQASVDLIGQNPSRLLTGYGADTLYLAYRPLLPARFSRHENAVIPDRAHNATYDALLTNGALGLVAEIAIVAAALLAGLRALGLAHSIRQRRTLAMLALGGAVAGAALPCALDQGLRYVAPGAVLGAVLGLTIHLLGVRRSEETAVPPAHALLLTGAVAALVAHVVEIQFGIPVVATRLYFWVFAAVIVALAMPLVGDRGAPGSAQKSRETSGADELWLRGDMVTVIPMVGLVLVVLCANFFRLGLDLAKHGPALALFFGGVWLAGAAFVGLEAGYERDASSRLATYAATTIGLCLFFLAIHDRWTLAPQMAYAASLEVARALAVRSSRRIDVVHWFILGIIGLRAAIAFARADTSRLGWIRPPRARWLAYALVLAAALVVAERTNVADSRADVIAKLALAYERTAHWASAAALHEEALRIRPREDRYALNLGAVWMQQAQQEKDAAQQQRDFELARAGFERAQELSPLDPDHPRNLAKLHRSWAKLSADQAAREVHRHAADDSYRRTAVLSPQNPPLFDEWATLYLEDHDTDKTIELLDHSVALDDTYTTTYWLRANAYIARGDLDAALADYDRALDIDPMLLPALSGKAMVLAQLERIDDAIAVCETSLGIEPTDAVSWNNLVLLLRQQGKRKRALAAAEDALNLVDAAYKPTFEELVAQLQ